MANWVSHGLIVDPSLESYYLAARVTVDATGDVVHPKEYRTVNLFNHLFSKFIFRESIYGIDNQNPAIGSAKACDIIINYFTDDFAHQVLCFVEATRASNQTGSLIEALEKQARDYCKEFLNANANNDTDTVYACTLIGASIRCWIARRDVPGIIGFWSGDQRGSFRYYLDIGLDENRSTLERAFQKMKSVPVSQERIGTTHADM